MTLFLIILSDFPCCSLDKIAETQIMDSNRCICQIFFTRRLCNGVNGCVRFPYFILDCNKRLWPFQASVFLVKVEHLSKNPGGVFLMRVWL